MKQFKSAWISWINTPYMSFIVLVQQLSNKNTGVAHNIIDVFVWWPVIELLYHFLSIKAHVSLISDYNNDAFQLHSDVGISAIPSREFQGGNATVTSQLELVKSEEPQRLRLRSTRVSPSRHSRRRLVSWGWWRTRLRTFVYNRNAPQVELANVSVAHDSIAVL